MEKAISRLKYLASVHNLWKEHVGEVSRRLQPDLRHPVASPKHLPVIHFPEHHDSDNPSPTHATQISITGNEGVDVPVAGMQEATRTMPKIGRTMSQQPGMSSAVYDGEYREAGQWSSIGMRAPARSASGPRQSGSGVVLPGILLTPRVGRWTDPDTYAQ